MKRWGAAIVLMLAVALAAAQPAAAFLDKTRFAVHLGVAYYCFHHWVLNPYREGSFAGGAPHRTASLVKGGLALLFAVHEVHVAKDIAAKSNDPLLHKLDGEVAGLSAAFAAVALKMKNGKFDPSDANALTDQTGKVNADAAAGGTQIKDVPVAVPGT